MNLNTDQHIDNIETINLKKEININDKALSIWIDVINDKGEIVHSAPGHSFVANFFSPFIAQFSGNTVPHDNKWIYYNEKSAISSIQAGVDGGTRLNWATASGSLSTTSGSDQVQISGSQPYPGMDGRWMVNSTVSNYYLCADVPYDANYTASTAAVLINRKQNDTAPIYNWFTTDALIVGYNPNIPSASINLQYFDVNRHSGNILTYNAIIVSVPTQDLTQTEFVITRTYTNSKTNWDILIDTIMLESNALMMSFDKIPLQILSPGKTLTINFRIRTLVTNNAVFLFQFAQWLYRQMSDASPTFFDTTGVGRSDAKLQASDLRVAVMGAKNLHASYYITGQQMGIQLGRGQDGTIGNTAATAPAMYFVEGHISHGTGSNQLYYYGTTVDPVMSMSLATNTASCEIVALYENKSSIDINVTEYALVANLGSQYNNIDTNWLMPRWQIALYREKLSDVLIVSASSFIKTTLTIQMNA